MSRQNVLRLKKDCSESCVEVGLQELGVKATM